MSLAALSGLALAQGAAPAASEGPSDGPSERQSVPPLVRDLATEPSADEASANRPAGKPAASADRPAPRPEPSLLEVRPGRSVAIRSAPGGDVVARAGSRTEFGSRTVMSVATVRGRWLGVRTEKRPNGRVGWVKRSRGSVRLDRTEWSLHADLSRRSLELRRGERVVRRVEVAIGGSGSPTPTGRFAVTDKLRGADYSPYFGCCILALSGTQPNPPPGWTGGNRLAIHGTNAPATVGKAVSAGCLRAGEDDMQALMRRVPVGTPVTIRR